MAYSTDQFWRLESNGAVTMYAIAAVRVWAGGILGAQESKLVLVRESGRTKATLRFFLTDAIGEIDVAALIALKRQRLKRARLELLLREACRYEELPAPSVEGEAGYVCTGS